MRNLFFLLGFSAVLFFSSFFLGCENLPGLPVGGTSSSSELGSELLGKAGSQMPPSLLYKLGNAFYDMEISDRKKAKQIEEDKKIVEQIKNIFDQLKKVAKRNSKYAKVAKDFDWRLNIIKDDNKKLAKAFSGGGIAVYEGVFRTAENEGALAAILGHEIAHTLERHELKRISKDTVAALGAGGIMAGSALNPKKMDPKIMLPLAGSLGVGYVVGSRMVWDKQDELDADCIGLELAAEAGYDPEKALGIWRRMQKDPDKNNKEIDFLDEHPINEDRLKNLNDVCLSNAKDIYLNLEQSERQSASRPLPGQESPV